MFVHKKHNTFFGITFLRLLFKSLSNFYASENVVNLKCFMHNTAVTLNLHNPNTSIYCFMPIGGIYPCAVLLDIPTFYVYVFFYQMRINLNKYCFVSINIA